MNNYINISVPTNRATNYMKQKLIGLQGEINISQLILGYFNLSISVSKIHITGRETQQGVDILKHASVNLT